MLPNPSLESGDIQSAITLSGEEGRAFPCQRDGCDVRIQPGQPAYFVKGKDNKVRVCEGCKEYYVVKHQTRKTTQKTVIQGAYPSAHSSAAPPPSQMLQTNSQRLNVQRIERNICRSFQKDTSAKYQQLIRAVNVSAVPAPGNLNAGIGGHSTHFSHPLSREKASGYTPQHAKHSEEYQKFVNRAYASNQDTIPIKLLLAYVDESCDTVTRLPALSQMDNQYSIYSSFETMVYQMLRLGQDALQKFEDQSGATGLNYDWSKVTGIQLRDITKDQNSASRAGAGVDLQGPTVAKFRAPGCNTLYLSQYGKWTPKKQGHQEWKPNVKSVLFRMDIPADDWERFEGSIEDFKRFQATYKPGNSRGKNLTSGWNNDSELATHSPYSEANPHDIQSTPPSTWSQSESVIVAERISPPAPVDIVGMNPEQERRQTGTKTSGTSACPPSTSEMPSRVNSTVPSKRRKMDEPDTPPPMVATTPKAWTSPSAKSVQDAVIHGGLVGKRSTGISATLPFTSVCGYMIVLPRRRFTEALDHTNLLTFEIIPDLNNSTMIELRVDFRLERQLGAGEFKTCHPAMIQTRGDDALFAFPSEKVCLKHMYAIKPLAKGGKKSKEGCSFPRLTGAPELIKIQIDANVHYWADMLLRSSYDIIYALSKTKGWPKMPATLPKLEFVRAAVLCVGKDNNPMRLDGIPIDKTYLLEEQIQCHPDDFVKYICNESAEILLDKSDHEYPTAVFLSAVQHLQYEKFQRTVFTSDWQGAKGLLTDPQIITSPEALQAITGKDLPPDLFGEGNLEEAFSSFPTEHTCTPWCDWFGLVEFVARKDERTGEAFFPSTLKEGTKTK